MLVIIAHPDDELIWMGGLLLENKNNWDTIIISLCRREDKDRAPKFFKACQEYQAKGFMSDLEDENLKPISLEEIKGRIQEFADGEFDYIFAHGKNGEYGHIRHIEIHSAVKEMLLNNKLRAKKVFFFSYLKNNKYAYPNKNADKFINLKREIFLIKKKIIMNIYGFQKNGFEEKTCGDAEAFDIE